MMKRRDQKGFTLIEIVVASFILVIGMSMIGAVIMGVVKKNFLSLNHTQAVIMAQNKIEELLNEGYHSSNMNDGYYENPLNPTNESGDSIGIFYQYWNIEDVNPIEKAKLLTSIVEWEDADGEMRSVILAVVSIDESN